MDAVTFISQSLGQVHERLTKSLERLTSQDVAWRPAAGANTIVEILWHVARAEDRMAKDAAGLAMEVWESQEWHLRVNLSAVEGLDDGYRFLELGLTAPALDDLVAYLNAVHRRTPLVLFEACRPPGWTWCLILQTKGAMSPRYFGT